MKLFWLFWTFYLTLVVVAGITAWWWSPAPWDIVGSAIAVAASFTLGVIVAAAIVEYSMRALGHVRLRLRASPPART